MNITKLHPKDQKDKGKKAFDETVKEGKSIYQLVLLRKDKTRVPVILSSNLIELHGKKHVLTVSKEITEQKKAY